MNAIFNPADSYNNVCGVGNFSDRPYVYYFNPIQCAVDVEVAILSGCPAPRFCVKKCPHTTFSMSLMDLQSITKPSQKRRSLVDSTNYVQLKETNTGVAAWFRKLNASEPLICDYAVNPTLLNVCTFSKT